MDKIVEEKNKFDDINWSDLGLKCGIEIHQQLEGKKLFCNCPTEIRDDSPDFVFTRKLRAVVGELGNIDKAAAQEMKKNRFFIYEGYRDTNCLIEMDEQPPMPPSQDNITTVLTVSKMLKASIVDEIQFMRKTIVDGSNTSAFQRTALVSRNGKIEIDAGTIHIPTIILEEDAAKIIKEDKNSVTYRLDRLGIPLIEISTEPDIKTPEQCKETAEKIGMLLRSTGKAKRGLGTIRQDVNVSIMDGSRVEIKGAQDLRSLPKLVATEAMRQKKLLDIKNELKKRNCKEIVLKIVDVTEIMKHSGSKIVSKSIQGGGKVLGICLPKFAGLIGQELQPNKRLGTEMSERAKVVAGIGGIFHSDELPAYGIEQREVDVLKGTFACKPEDAFVIVADENVRCELALFAVVQRANDALVGVPSEVRKANDDNTTSYLRPMPGAARMYPETDISPLHISKETIDSIKLPELIETKITRYQTFGLNKDIAQVIAKSENALFFEQLLKRFKKIKPAYIAEILVGAESSIKRQFNVDICPSDKDFADLFSALENGEISKESVLEILKENKPVETVLYKYKLLSDSELKEKVAQIVNENQGLQFNALIGKAMETLRGKAEGKKIAELLQQLIKQK